MIALTGHSLESWLLGETIGDRLVYDHDNVSTAMLVAIFEHMPAISQVDTLSGYYGRDQLPALRAELEAS